MTSRVPCTRRDLEEASLLQRKLSELFRAAQPGNPAAESLMEVRRLCDRALLAVDDEFCQQQLCEVERHAANLFSAGGVLFQKRLILDTLEQVHARIASLHQLHRAADTIVRPESLLERR